MNELWHCAHCETGHITPGSEHEVDFQVQQCRIQERMDATEACNTGCETGCQHSCVQDCQCLCQTSAEPMA